MDVLEETHKYCIITRQRKDADGLRTCNKYLMHAHANCFVGASVH